MEKLRVMFVDDEQLVLDVLEMLLDWESSPFEICAAAKSADEAIRKFHQTQPQVVVVDVFMPGKDGLSVADYIHKNAPETAIIILSSYENFQYARRAVQVGATCYLLKNELTKETLTDALQQAGASYSERRQRNQAFWNQAIGDFLAGRENAQLERLFDFEKFRYAILAVQERRQLLEEQSRTEDRETLEKLHLRMQAGCPECVEVIGHVKSGSSMHIQLLQIQKAIGEHEFYDRMGALWEELKPARNRIAFVSGRCGSQEQLLKQWQDMCRCAECSIFLPQGELGYLPRLQIHLAGNAPEGLPDAAELYRRLAAARADQVHGIIHRNFSELYFGRWKPSSASLLIQTMDTVLRQMRAEWAIPEVMFCNTEKELYSVYDCERYFSRMFEIAAAFSLEQVSPYTQQAFRILRKNYAQEVSAREIANEVGVSESHLRTVMKADTGRGISYHLQKIRMDAAGELLRCGQYSVREAARMSGYNNVSYFIKMFKKEHGYYPSEYGERQQ